MEVLEHGHDQIKQYLMEVLLHEQGSPRERFINALMKLFKEVKRNLGLMTGTMARSVNHYFVIGFIVGMVLMMPAVFTLLGVTHPIFEISPAEYCCCAFFTPQWAWMCLTMPILARQG